MLTNGFPRYGGDRLVDSIPPRTKESMNRGSGVVVIAPYVTKVKRHEKLDGTKVHSLSYFLPFALQRLCYSPGIASDIWSGLLAKLRLPFFFFPQLFSLILVVNKEWQIHSAIIPSASSVD